MTTSPRYHDGLRGVHVREQLEAFCQAVLDGKQFKRANEKIEAFLADDEAKGAYIAFTRKRAEINDREERGFEPTAGQLSELQKMHTAMIANPVIADFIEASDELEAIRQAVFVYLEKTFEICKVPQARDFEDDEGEN